MSVPGFAYASAGVSKTHNGYYIVHFEYTPTGSTTPQVMVVAIRSAPEFYTEALRAISGIGIGSAQDTLLITFTNGMTTTLAGTIGFDVAL